MFCSKDSGGYLHEATEKRVDPAQAMLSGDSSMVTGMLNRNLQMMVPQASLHRVPPGMSVAALTVVGRCRSSCTALSTPSSWAL